MDDHDLETWPDSELYRVVGIMMCERMLYARDAEIEDEIDKRIAALEHEISRRVRHGEVAEDSRAGMTKQSASERAE